MSAFSVSLDHYCCRNTRRLPQNFKISKYLRVYLLSPLSNLKPFSGDRRASRCASHKLKGHVDITSRKCEREGCNRIPSFRSHPTGVLSQQGANKKGRVRFCAQHKQKDMEDYHIKARGCRFLIAGAAPGEGGGEGEGVPCNRTSSFGFKGGKRTRCAKHKIEGEVSNESQEKV